MQVISGNFNTPNDFSDINQIEFTISALVAIVINWLPLLAAAALVIGLIKRIFSERVNDMRLLDAFLVKDRVVKEAIYNAMSPADQERLRPIVETAFATGTTEWLDDWLPDIYGKPETEELVDRLERDAPGMLRRMRGDR